MQYFPPALENLVEQFAKLPGVGVKSAQRLAFYVLSMPDDEANAFAQAVISTSAVTTSWTTTGTSPFSSNFINERSIFVIYIFLFFIYSEQAFMASASVMPPS